jgi:phosphoribosylformimino-5-aminoimidazole carboxamide ribotide isomerase
VKIEVGGGVRNIDSIHKYTDAGVEKVILGSAAIKDKFFLKDACEKFPNKIALGLDAKDGYLSVSGWKENSNQLTLDYLREVNDFGVSRLIYTDINRDGMKQSPNFEETTNVANISNCPVIISGGVSSIDDIKKAKELNNSNIEGIIVGKAIYDGDIKLEELVKELNA